MARRLTFSGVASRAAGQGYLLTRMVGGKHYYFVWLEARHPPYDRARTLKEVDDFLALDDYERNRESYL